MNKILIVIILLLGAGTSMAQESVRKAGEGQNIRHRIFSDYDQAISKTRAKQAATPPKEATLTSKQALRQHLFPGSNGAGVPRTAPAGARKASTQQSQAAGKLPSNVPPNEAALKAKPAENAKAAPKAIDPAAQGKEPSLHYEAPKVKNPKN